MPTVPRYQGGVATQAIAGNRENPSAPAGAFGVPTPNFVGGAITNIQQIILDQKQKSDQVAALSADNELAELETRLLYDSKNGALNMKGRNAFDIPDRVDEEWRKGTSEIESKLSSPDQRRAFANARDRRQASIHAAVQKHVSNQIDAYDLSETESFLVNERSAALANYGDAARVEEGVDRQHYALSDLARRQGTAPETLKRWQQDAASKTYAGVLDRMLTNDEDLAAEAYYGQVKEYIAGEDRAKIEKALEEGSLRGNSQRSADAIMTKFGEDRQAATDAVKDIKDSKLRDAVEQRVSRAFQEKKQIEQEQQEDMYLRATNMLDASPMAKARDVIPAPLWSQLSLSMRNALENRSQDINNDDQKWLTFLEMSPQAVADLNKAQFESQFWAHLDKSHRTRAEALWNGARDAMANKDAQPNLRLANTINFKDRLFNTMGRAGVVPPNKTLSKFSKNEASTYAAMEQQAAKEIEQFELTALGGKREATGEEMQKIIDGVVLNRVFIDRPHAGDYEKLGWKTSNDELGRAYVPIDAIPPEDRVQLRNALTARGMNITERKLERLFAAVVMKNRGLYESILGEK